MSLNVSTSVPVITVFLQGLLSFFSPCVFPLIPVYMGYLAGGTVSRDDSGKPVYNRAKVMVNTFFFVLGISFAFFVLGFGMTALGRFFSDRQLLLARIGGVIVILFGLYQLGLFGTSVFLSTERRLPLRLDRMRMSPVTALLMGFVLSFAWSPCVGPTLSSVLLMATSASSSAAGFLLIGVYTLGYIIPFLLLGLFTSSLLDFFGKHKGIVKYTVKIGGVLMILMGLLMISGRMNSLSSYLSSLSSQPAAVSEPVSQEAPVTDLEEDPAAEAAAEELSAPAAEPEASPAPQAAEESSREASDAAEETAAEKEDTRIQAPGFTLTDQYGEEHSLSDYRGKVVFLNFWATWCPPCRAELPYIQEIHEEYQALEDPDVVILGVVFPGSSGEGDVDSVKAFLDQYGLTYPVLMDTGAELVRPYYISAFPTTFLIDPEGYVLGYIPGGMDKATMLDIIRQAKELSGIAS